MITALGARYSSNPAVKIVGASFANAKSEDWGVPQLPAEVTAWFAAGYTSAKVLDAGSQILNATMAAFPNQYVALAVTGDGNRARHGLANTARAPVSKRRDYHGLIAALTYC